MTEKNLIKYLSQEKKESLNLRVTEEEKDLIRNYAKKNKISNSSVVRIALNNFFQEESKKNK